MAQFILFSEMAMRFFALVFKDIVKFIRGRKIIFATVMAGLVLNTIGISFYYGYFLNIYRQTVEYYDKTNSYDFRSSSDLNSPDGCPVCDYLLSGGGLPKVRSMIVTQGGESQTSVQQTVGKYAGAVPVGKYSGGNEDVLSGRYFTSDELRLGDHVTIASTDALAQERSALTNGDKLEIGDGAYTIIGQVVFCDIAYGCYIPINAYTKDGFAVKYIHVTFSSALSGAQKDRMTADLLRRSPGLEIDYPPSVDASALRSFWSYFTEVILLFMLAMTNVFSLIYYWAKSNDHKYSIFIICGCNKFRVFGMILAETMLMAVFSSLAGIAAVFSLEGIFISYNLSAPLAIQDFSILLGACLLSSLAMGAVIGARVAHRLGADRFNLGGVNY